MSGNHPCRAPGCPRILPYHLLMCPPHWRRVPRPVQREVYAAWREVQEQGGALTDRYLQAVEAAIASLRAP